MCGWGVGGGGGGGGGGGTHGQRCGAVGECSWGRGRRWAAQTCTSAGSSQPCMQEGTATTTHKTHMHADTHMRSPAPTTALMYWHPHTPPTHPPTPTRFAPLQLVGNLQRLVVRPRQLAAGKPEHAHLPATMCAGPQTHGRSARPPGRLRAHVCSRILDAHRLQPPQLRPPPHQPPSPCRLDLCLAAPIDLHHPPSPPLNPPHHHPPYPAMLPPPTCHWTSPQTWRHPGRPPGSVPPP